MTKILIADGMDKGALEQLKAVPGFEVTVNKGMSEADLIAAVPGVSGIVVRSASKITRPVIEAGKDLKVLVRAGIGLDNIDREAAKEKGIFVANTPAATSITVAEHTFGLMLGAVRNHWKAILTMKAHKWEKKALEGTELYGKTLGIIGFGRIGHEVAKRALAFGMTVVAYDIIPIKTDLAVKQVPLDELLGAADLITLHVPKQAKPILGEAEFAKAKTGVIIVNVARGGIIDEAALADAVKSGKVAGIAFDVYSSEPPEADNPLLSLDHAVTTPHLGASTEEAQVNVAIDISEQIVDVLNGKPARSAVNMPALSAEVMAAVSPYLTLGERIGAMLTQLADGPVEGVEISYCGELSSLETGPVGRAVLKGLFQPILTEQVNMVNAPVIAESRGIRVTESKTKDCEDYNSLLSVKAKVGKSALTIAGTLFGKKDIRIVHLDGHSIDIVPSGAMLVTTHIDKPGIIGRVGTLLGGRGVNIGGMHVGREGIGKHAVMVLNVDGVMSEDVIRQIQEMDGIESARQVHFGDI